MPKRHLPPFAALRAFEAVARTLSFTGAAQELGVTQAAISRQMRALEQELGVRLVERHPTHNSLSPAGSRLSVALREGMDIMEAGVRDVSSQPGQKILTVSVAPFFSASWLTPRIMGFIEANPGIDLRLHHSYEPPDYRRDQIDLGINWGHGQWPGVEAEKILDGSLTPVCAPEFFGNRKQTLKPGDLIKQPLFYEFRREDWADWFAASGTTLSGLPAATKIDDSNALRRIAMEGHGIALFFRTLVEEDLAVGRMLLPFDVTVDTGNHYFLNYPSDRELSAGARRFRRWLQTQISG
ncbi:LysR substrate-binding domain-containing protein [Denitrobaculum tricleocarpae]|uniref:LysR family transcriptional regulator n=1 Tax=Denitrobaculum tricleocarpae TaxID=2591009 RepID=A0A545U128_9PROT|nr:LysR substrate-binding domain-containing protein [Denitrobaculum tricleocarpae]TQV83181.1 LysR family transcriptional regulator [Denitrobaculum tricleocarpae]